MLTFNGNFKVYIALEPCDMRMSFHGLSAMVRNHLDLDPLSGAAYLFTNKARQPHAQDAAKLSRKGPRSFQGRIVAFSLC